MVHPEIAPTAEDGADGTISAAAEDGAEDAAEDGAEDALTGLHHRRIRLRWSPGAMEPDRREPVDLGRYEVATIAMTSLQYQTGVVSFAKFNGCAISGRVTEQGRSGRR